MPFEEQYRRQVALLLRAIPLVAAEDCFALKGGTAINLFIRPVPRLSVDIDLTYLPVQPRADHLRGPDGQSLPHRSPFKYVDSATVPFVVVPSLIVSGVPGVVLGCRAVVTNTGNGRSVEAVVADRGPSSKLGEISLACARAIGVPVNEAARHPANSGGTESHAIRYQLFPGTAAVVGGVTYPLQPS